MFLCGCGSFRHQDEDDRIESRHRTPKKSKKSKTNLNKGSSNKNKNPYADRGLDKFYSLLEDLEIKKQKIYTQKGSEDIAFVRFVYKDNSDLIKPIVVKVKKDQEKISNQDNSIPAEKAIVETELVHTETPRKKICLRCKESFKLKLDNLKTPYFYFAVIVVFILVFLAMYGRSFAILCTSIGWYVGPIVVERSSSSSSSSSPSGRKLKREDVTHVSKHGGKKINVHSEGLSSPRVSYVG